MTQWPDTDLLLEKFRAWLGEVHDASQAAVNDLPSHENDDQEANSPETAARQSNGHEAMGPASGATEDAAVEFGLVDVVREFTALRHEVKLQTKSARGLEEQTASTIAALEEAGQLFLSVEPNEAEAARRAALPLIESLADLDESLARAHAVVESARGRLAGESLDAFPRQLEDLYAAQPAWKRWLCRWWYIKTGDLWQADAEDRKRIVNSLAEGYVMVRKRLERAMAKEGLYRIASVGLPVDPHAMNVVEVVDSAAHAAGTVVEEVRPGYRWNDKVIRCAEVRAARNSHQNPYSSQEQE